MGTQKFFALEDSLFIGNAKQGSIEITESQYNEAVSAKMSGRRAFVRNGELVVFSGVMVTAWCKETKDPKEFDEFDSIPSDYTKSEPVGDVVWNGYEWKDREKSPTGSDFV